MHRELGINPGGSIKKRLCPLQCRWKRDTGLFDQQLADLQDGLSEVQTVLGEDFDSEAAFAERAGADGDGVG